MKNRYVELERFIASCMILLLHLYVSKGTWIFVEFFYLLTGCFTVSHLERKKDTIQDSVWYPLQYTWKKFEKLFPYTGLSLIWLWGIRLWAFEMKGNEIIKWFLCLPTELMMLSGSGMVPKGLQITEEFYTPRLFNDHLWYICCLLFVLPLVVYLLMYLKKAKAVIITILPMLLYGILVMKSGTITGWHDSNFAFFFCSMRALAGLLLGAFAYYVSKWWSKKRYTCFGKICLTLIEVGGFIAVLVISHLTSLSYDALFIGIFFISVSLSNSGVTYTSKLNIKSIDFLGAISLPIYCLQLPVMATCYVLGIRDLSIQFTATILVSVVTEVLFRLLEMLWKVCKPRYIRLFIKTD